MPLNIPNNIQYSRPTYIHSHTSTFLECMKQINKKQALDKIYNHLESIKIQGIQALSEGYNYLHPIASNLRSEVIINNNVELNKSGELFKIIQEIDNFAKEVGESYKKAHDIDRSVVFKTNKTISQIFHECLDSTMESTEVEKEIDKFINSFSKSLVEELSNSKRNVRNITIYRLNEIQLKTLKRTLPQAIINKLVSIMRAKYVHEDYKELQEKRNKLREKLIEFSSDISKLPSMAFSNDDEAKKQIQSILSRYNNKSFATWIGDVKEALKANILYNELIFTSNEVVEVSLTGDKQKEIVTDITVELDKITEKIGISNKESTIKNGLFSVASQMKLQKSTIPSKLYDQMLNDESTKNLLLYIISNYEALTRFRVTDKKRNDSTGKEKDIYNYNLLPKLQIAFSGFNLLYSLLGPVLKYTTSETIENQLRELRDKKGLPLILSAGSKNYWTDEIMKNLITAISNINFGDDASYNENSTISVIQKNTESQFNKTFNPSKLARLYYQKTALDPLNHDDRLQLYYDNSELLFSPFQIKDGELKRIVLNQGRMTFDVEKIYNLK